MPTTRQIKVGEIHLPVYKDKRWVMAYRRGRVFEIDGRTLELFPVQVLAETIARTSQSIIKWEKSGLFPAPMFKIPVVPKRSNRWYSKIQIANIRAVYQQYPKRHEVRSFLKAVWPIFYQLEKTPEAERGKVR